VGGRPHLLVVGEAPTGAEALALGFEGHSRRRTDGSPDGGPERYRRHVDCAPRRLRAMAPHVGDWSSRCLRTMSPFSLLGVLLRADICSSAIESPRQTVDAPATAACPRFHARSALVMVVPLTSERRTLRALKRATIVSSAVGPKLHCVATEPNGGGLPRARPTAAAHTLRNRRARVRPTRGATNESSARQFGVTQSEESEPTRQADLPASGRAHACGVASPGLFGRRTGSQPPKTRTRGVGRLAAAEGLREIRRGSGAPSWSEPLTTHEHTTRGRGAAPLRRAAPIQIR
jgi:hypothetical protein